MRKWSTGREGVEIQKVREGRYSSKEGIGRFRRERGRGLRYRS